MSRREPISCPALAARLLARCCSADRRGAAPTGKLEYNRDIRPILAENCFACHGPDSAARKADLRLDQREAAVEAGAIVPGNPEESELIARIHSDDADELMPPPKSHKTLTAAQKDAPQALDRRRAPSTSRTGRSSPRSGPSRPRSRTRRWVRNPIDRFVLAKLEAKGLTPAPEADRRTLARRAQPRPDRPAARARPRSRRSSTTRSPDAYEKLVDRLLASPALGRAPRPLLARRRPLRRHPRHPLRQLPRDLALPRLGHQRLQPQHAVRPVHDRAARRRPAARTRRSTSRSPRASTAATSRPTRAARSPRSTSSSTPATAPRRRRRSGWG